MDISFEPGSISGENIIPLCVPEIRGNEWNYIKECLDTNWVSSVGRYVDKFQESIVEFVGTGYAAATVNGTAALQISLLIAGVKPDDEVLLPTLTFISPANVIRYVGAWPVFIDVEPDYWQLDVRLVEEFLRTECQRIDGFLKNKTTGRRVKAVIPVHILGHPVDMKPLKSLCEEFELVLIEDATESLGARYRGENVGHLGDIACFSFNGNKIITTGGGGMVTSDNEEWIKKARYLITQAKDNPLEYIHDEIGFNFRLTNIQAAMGCAQMELLGEYVQAKRRIADTYSANFESVDGIYPMQEADWAFSTFWMYTVLVEESEFGVNSRELLRELIARGIQTRPLWQPIHLSKAHSNCQSFHCRNGIAEEINQKAISLPCSVGILEDEQQTVIKTITKIHENNHRS